MKKCPKCAEQVQDDAKVCRFCGFRFLAFDRADHAMRNMGCGTMVLILFLVFYAASQCSPEKPAAPTAGDKLIAEEVRTEHAVKLELRNPESAVFKHYDHGCGAVNSQNGFGGMTGYQRFIVTENNVVFLQEQADHPLVFQDMWRRRCLTASAR